MGASTQQAEINDVVRQLREKHAQDIASWRKAVAELEGQLSTFKVKFSEATHYLIVGRSGQMIIYSFPFQRTQHILQEESLNICKESVETQTEYLFEEEIERRERELAAQEFQEEFGGIGDIGDAFLNELQNLREPDIVRRVRQEWKTERVNSKIS